MTLIDTKLYELFAYKELEKGCEIEIHYKSLEHKEMGGDDYEVTVIRSIVGEFLSGNGHNFEFYYDETIFSFLEYGECGLTNTYEILGHEPQLHDVVRIMKMNGIHLYMDNEQIIIFQDSSVSPVYVPYNPTLSLINQEESTKQAIVDLFSN